MHIINFVHRLIRRRPKNVGLRQVGANDSMRPVSFGFHPGTLDEQVAATRAYMERYHGWMQGGDRSDRDQHWYAKGGLIPSGSSLATNGTGKPEEVWAPREDSAYLPLPREGVVPEPLGDPEEDRRQLPGDQR